MAYKTRRVINGIPVCKRGHPIVGWNARPNLTHGRRYFACRECSNASASRTYERNRRMPTPNRFYVQYWNETSYVDQSGWRIYDRHLTYGNGDIMPIAQCWRRDAAFHIRDLLNAEELQKILKRE